LITTIAALTLFSAAAVAAPPLNDSSYSRGDADAIHADAADILSNPPYAKERTWLELLLGKIMKWLTRGSDEGSGWGRTIAWIIIIWCSLALAAMIGHMIWTLLAWWRPWDRGRRGADGGDAERSLRQGEWSKLYQQMQEAAEAGSFPHAVALMMAAMLAWLAQRHLLQLHPSKTNGDYARELAPAAAGADFRDFVRSFDRAVYGPAGCDRGAFDQLHSMFQQIRQDAQQETHK
jgi:hypothetical protein